MKDVSPPDTDGRARSVDNVRGGTWILFAALCFSGVGAAIKMLDGEVPVLQVLFVRQCTMGLIMAPFLVRGFPGNLVTRQPGLHLARVALAFVALTTGFVAFSHLPLAEVTTIGFARTFFITIFASFSFTKRSAPAAGWPPPQASWAY